MKKTPINIEEANKLLGSSKLDVSDIEAGLVRMTGDAGSGKTNNAQSLQRLLDIVEILEDKMSKSGTDKWFVPGTPYGIENCPKHSAFFAAGKDFPERCFLASNRTGKSLSGAYELAVHLTGEYPFWWNGKVFDKPISAWAAGSTGRSTRDIVQKELLGPIGAWGTGMIPLEKLGRFWALQGVPQGVDVIEVKHKSGGWSTLGFKNYEQDVTSFYGTAKHVVWLDEECPRDIYNECLMRTMTTGGIVYVTFTPLKGLTPFVVNFCSKATFLAGASPLAIPEDKKGEEEEGEDSRLANLKTAKAVVQAGWDDAPWLEEDAKQRMLDDTPPHLRAARSKGIPAMGSGNVYPIPFEEISCAPFQIPQHYKRMYALDVGWNRTAVLWAAIDPDTDNIYIYDEYYHGKEEPAVHAAAIRGRGGWIEGVIDPASRGRSQIDGQQLLAIYKSPELGLRLYPAKNEVESGIANTWQKLSTGKLRVFSNLTNFAREYLVYRRDENGKVVKDNDHLMDCMRYIINNQHRAVFFRRPNAGGVTDGSRRYDI